MCWMELIPFHSVDLLFAYCLLSDRLVLRCRDVYFIRTKLQRKIERIIEKKVKNFFFGKILHDSFINAGLYLTRKQF